MEHDTLFDELDRARFARSLAVAIFAGLALVLMTYFVQKKVQNDSAIAHDTKRIADALEKPKCAESSEPVDPKAGWKRKSRVYARIDSGPCYELTHSKKGHQDVVSKFCGEGRPLPSFEEAGGTMGVILGHTYGFKDAPYSNGPEACK